jgi:hypothetical protein
MEAIYKLKASEIDSNLISTIQKLFGQQEITISITSEPDETTYLMMKPANEKHLLDSIAQEPFISFTDAEFTKHANDLLSQTK